MDTKPEPVSRKLSVEALRKGDAMPTQLGMKDDQIRKAFEDRLSLMGLKDLHELEARIAAHAEDIRRTVEDHELNANDLSSIFQILYGSSAVLFSGAFVAYRKLTNTDMSDAAFFLNSVALLAGTGAFIQGIINLRKASKGLSLEEVERLRHLLAIKAHLDHLVKIIEKYVRSYPIDEQNKL